MIIELDGELYRVTWRMHRTPGKGPASMQTKLKGLLNGKNMEYKFRSNETVERAELDTRSLQYLYEDGEGLIFMDQESFDQITVRKDLVGQMAKFLRDGEIFSVTFHNDQPIGLDLPKNVDLKVVSAPPAIKKATATAQLRPIECENGITVQAPAFIKEGDIIKINTETGNYVERV